MKNQFIQNDFELLPITFDHVVKLQGLKFYHRDPFDRIIIAQAISENFTIITKDQNFMKYDIRIVW
jgi:PIN domain nuclease of toxin-antitoxin system